MPSGPPELHEKFCKLGPHFMQGDDQEWGLGDANAQHFLESRGFILSPRWEWFHLNPEKTYSTMSDDEAEAIYYLQVEWDFGGFIELKP